MSEQEQSIVKLEVSEIMLKGFKEKFALENLPTSDNPEGYKFLADGVRVLKGHWIANEKFRDSMVRPLNDRIREFNRVCKDMDLDLHDLARPMQEEKKKEDDRVKAEKAEKLMIDQRRIADINRQLDQIRQSPVDMIDKTPEEIQQAIDDLNQLDPQNDFDEFVTVSIDTISSTLEKLETLHQRAVDAVEVAKAKEIQDAKDALAQEKQDEIDRKSREAKEEQDRKDQEELAKLRKEKAEREAKDIPSFSESLLTIKEPLEKTEDIYQEPVTDQEAVDLVEDLNNELSDLEEMKLDTADAIHKVIQAFPMGEVGGAGSAIAREIMIAIYTGKIPNVGFINQEDK